MSRMRESICVVVTLVEVPKDDGRLARRAARRLGIRLITPRLILTRYDELPVHPAVVEDYGANIEVAPDVPAPLPGGMDVQINVENIPLPPGTPPAANWFVDVENIPLPDEVDNAVEERVSDPIPIIEEPEEDPEPAAREVEPAALYVAVPAGGLVVRLIRVQQCGADRFPPPPSPPIVVPDDRPCSPVRPAIEVPQFHMLLPSVFMAPPPPPPPAALAIEPAPVENAPIEIAPVENAPIEIAPVEYAPVRPATPPVGVPELVPVSPRRLHFRARGFRAVVVAQLPIENVRCFRCHLHGHVSYNCPNREVAPGERCFNCEGLSHVQMDCPEPPQFHFQQQADLGRGLRRRFMSARWPRPRARRNMFGERDGQRNNGSGVAPGMVRAATAPPAPGPRIPPASAQRGRTLRDRVGGRNGRGRGLGRVRARVPQAHLPPPANVSSSSSDEEFWECAPLDDDQADELRDTQRRLAEVAQERNDALQALQDVLAEVETEREEQCELVRSMENNLIVILDETSALRAENACLCHAAAPSNRQPAIHSRGRHKTAFCNQVTYPITRERVDLWHDSKTLG
ncbi:hypothetical protein V9T40_003370 [Parthenolecanium corni]|uniref:CCHC-type domain-containing protein n=1 Tax=Parthenolecanium corni TaxID=536013 RepID=A0AAN9TSE3_9HEMI